jgi:hypothetical protein
VRIALGAPAMSSPRRTFLALLLSAAAAFAQQAPPPGYGGSFPSERAQQALRDAMATPWEDTKTVAGGGTWQLRNGGVTPHALGPCRGDVMEARTAETKGPHLRLVRDHLAICFPTTTDGDVAATLRWLGRPVPEGIAGEPTANWTRAAARLAALGPEAAGLRAGLLADPTARARVELVVWKVGTDAEPVSGTAVLKMDGTPIPVRFAWPPKAEVGADKSHLRLAPGSTFVHPLDVDALLRDRGRESLPPGTWPLQLVLTVDTAGQRAPALTTAILELRVPEAGAGKR